MPSSLSARQRFTPDRYAVGNDVEHPDAILVRSHDMHAMTIPMTVKAIGRAGAGTNSNPVAAMCRLPNAGESTCFGGNSQTRNCLSALADGTNDAVSAHRIYGDWCGRPPPSLHGYRAPIDAPTYVARAWRGRPRP